MKPLNQDLQRKQLIFGILEELREQGERINADKVARLAKMGKQTVLPYYNEWRFAGELEKDLREELPEELVRALKRGISKWKHDLSLKAREQEETANAEIDQLKQDLQHLLEAKENLEQSIAGQQEQILRLDKINAQLQETNSQKDLELTRTNAELAAEQHTSETLRQQMEDYKKETALAAEQLEQRLDQRHQEQLNHWIKVVDDERRNKADLEKRLNQQKEEQTAIEKERNELGHRLDSKTRAFMDACEERNQLRKDSQRLQVAENIINQSTLLLDCSEKEIAAEVRRIINEQHQAKITQEKLNLSEQKTGQLEEMLNQQQTELKKKSSTEKELEKIRGYAEGLEKRLTEASKDKAKS